MFDSPTGSRAGWPSVISSRLRRFPRVREVIANQLFLLPVVTVFVFLFVIPLAQSTFYSFTDFNGYSQVTNFVGLDNYVRIFTNATMVSGFTFTLMYALGTTLAVTALAIPLALVLNRQFAGRNFVRAIYFFPAIPSVAILGLIWAFILSPLGSGALNSALGTIAGVGPLPWLSNSSLAQLSVILVGVWTATGWHALLYLAYLQAIPGDYYEVATIDGASGWQRFIYITLPLLTPAITISTLLLMTGGLKVFDLPYTLTKGGPGFSTMTITQSIIQNGIAQAKFGQASALAVVFMLVVGAVVALQLVISRRIESRIG